MRVLLVNPHTSSTNFKPESDSKTYDLFPNGLLFLAAVLEKGGHEVKILDSVVDLRRPIDFVTFRPQLIGFSVVTTPDILLAIAQSQAFRILLPEAKIVWGGVHPSLRPEETIRESYIDYVVIGAGEKPLESLASYLERGTPSCKEIPGLVYKNGDRMIKNPPSPELTDLDELPDPAWHLVDTGKYWAVTLDTSRGCPFSCAFCYNSVFHAGQRGDFSAERVIRQVEYLHGRYGAHYFCFFEDNFTFNRKRLRAFCQAVIEKNLNIRWDCESRADLNEADIALMARAGCVSVSLGVETGSRRLLEFLKKGLDLDAIVSTFWNLVKYRIEPNIYIMEAIPTETLEDFNMTRQLLHELDDPPTAWGRFIPYPGTPLYRYCLEKKLIEPPKRLAEWPHFIFQHYTQANLSHVPDNIINEAFNEWNSRHTSQRESFKRRHNLRVS
jgi:anaerobic magnesium-protoporphyrin IX monomethyl ester cyclase